MALPAFLALALGLHSSMAQTPKLSIERGQAGVKITFDGKLEQASDIKGAWTVVDGVTSPTTVNPTEAKKFYRARSVGATLIVYTYTRLFTLGDPFSTTGETLSKVIELGNANNSGTITGVSDYGDGEGAWMVDADGKGKVLSRPGLASPAGGTFGGGINGKISLNNSGNVAFGVDVDRGEGNVQEVVFFDRKANSWTSIARRGTAVKGGALTATLSFATINDGNDVAFAGVLPAGSGAYLYNAATKDITPVMEPGDVIAGTKYINARRVQVSQIGRIVTFEAQRDGDGNFGAYTWQNGVVSEVVAFGAPVPDASGANSGATFDELRGPIANEAGDIALLGHSSEGWGAFLKPKGGKLTRIAAPGDTIGGEKLKGVANSYRNDIRIGADGSVLFVAIFESDDRALFLRAPNGTLTEAARVGKSMKGIGNVTGIGKSIGGDSGLGLSNDGKLAVPIQTDDDKIQLVLAVPSFIELQPARKYTYKPLFELGTPFSTTGESLAKVIELGNVNTAGTVTGVSDYGDGEGAWLVDADGKGMVLSRPGLVALAGGKYGGGINGKISLNNSGNAAFGVDVDRGEGNVQEVVYFNRAANAWTSIARRGTTVKGGALTATLSFATINDSDDVAFAGVLAAGSGAYLYNAATKDITAVMEPGDVIAGTKYVNARRVQISQIGRIVTFEAQRDGDGNFGAYMWQNGVVTEVVGFGAPAPDADGLPTSLTFDELRGPIANGNGDIAVLGHTSEGWGAYLLRKGGKLVRIAAKDDVIGGGTLKQVANSYRNDIRIGPDGSVLFCAIFDNDERGLYVRTTDGQLHEVARVGKALAGIGNITGIGLSIGGDSGLGYSTDGKVAVGMGTDDGKVRLILCVPK